MSEVQRKEAPYLKTLKEVHQVVEPGNYLEIGSRFGESLFLADCPCIAIDPQNQLKRPLRSSDQFFEMTSDDFFVKHKVSELVTGSIDLAFIDGMHLAEFALRDFINVEANMPEDGVIMIDDVMPGKAEFAGREHDPKARFWTGDVYKLILILLALRPDLQIDMFAVQIKGLAVIRNLHPKSTVLRDAYDELEEGILGDVWNFSTVQELRARFSPHPLDQISKVLA